MLSLEKLLFTEGLDFFDNGSKEHQRFADKVKEILVDLTGDVDWLRVSWDEVPIDGDTPQEAAEFLMNQSYEPHHLLRD